MRFISSLYHKVMTLKMYLIVVFISLLLLDETWCTEIINVEYFIEEETGPGKFIGNTARESRLFENTGSDFVLLSFEPFTQGNRDVEFISVNSSSGVIRTAKNIDREAICQRDQTCKLKMDIGVYKRLNLMSTSQKLINVLKVVVVVTDINDNNPTFPKRVVNLFVPENKDVNTVLYASVAFDADAVGVNSTITYRLNRRSSVFELSTLKTPDGLEDLVITIKKVLDREVQKLYPITVVANDLGDNSRSGSVLINVQVTDVNDNGPIFGSLNYTVRILENSDITDPVVIVSASDKDEGLNAKLTYEPSPQASQDILLAFSIEADTGKIFARANLDFETRNLYQFYVKASDSGRPSEESFAYVTVQVIDVNDNAPKITINNGKDAGFIREHGSVGKYLGYIKVSDADSGVNGDVSCSITDSHFRLERLGDIDSGIYKIKLRKELDREDAPKRNVTIECRDGDAYPLSASASFEVTILDINDNTPMFIDSTLHGSVIENEDRGAFVLQVVATDLDDGENATLTYSIISSKDVSLFTIHPKTGVIRTTASLDREVKDEYYLTILVKDNGLKESLSASANVTIRIIDENDNPPKFTKQAFFNSIMENLAVNSSAGDVTASDADSKDNGHFKFRIMNHGSGADDGKYFHIDPDTGVIRSKKSFDREEKSVYIFRVEVYDPYVPNYSDIVNVTVTINDDNDHSPLIIKPKTDSRTFVLPFNTSIGTIITVIEVVDEDDSDLVEFSFQLRYQDSKPKTPLFSIDTYTGKLRLARPVTRDDVTAHQLQIIVSDGTSADSRSTVLELTMEVEAGSEEEMRGSSGDDSVNKLIIIVIIVVTFIIAIITLLVICLIRRVDKKRRPHPPQDNCTPMDTKLYQAAQWVSSVTSLPKDLGPEETEIVRSTLEVPGEKKKKKEVSFSLDEEVAESPDTSGSMGSVFTPSPNAAQKSHGVHPYRHSPDDNGFILVDGISSPDYSHHLYDHKNCSSTDPSDERQFMEVNRQGEDRYSDASSGDTGTSDSGRGGSEDECHAHTSSSGDGDHRHKLNHSGLLNSSGVGSFVSTDTEQQQQHHHHQQPQHMRRYPQHHQHNNALPPLQQQQQQYSDRSDSEDIPGSPTPMLSEDNRHCYIRTSLEKLPTRHGSSYLSGGSLQSSPSASTSHISNYSKPSTNRNKGGSGSSTLPSHSNTRATLSMNDCEGPYRVKKAEQHQQLLKTFSSPRAGNANVPQSSNSHPAWRKAKGLDTSWRSASSVGRDDDDNTTTSGSYTINQDDLREDNMNFPDIMV